MNWIQNMNRCVGPASWDASKPKETAMTHSVRVTTEDANNYSRILTLLGMEEEGDPVAEVAQLKMDKGVFALANEVAQSEVERLRGELAQAEQVLREIAEHVSQYSDHTHDSFRRGLMALMAPAHKVLKASAIRFNAI